MVVKLHMRQSLKPCPLQPNRLLTSIRADLYAGQAGLDFKRKKCCDETSDPNGTDLAEVSAFSAMVDFLEIRPGYCQVAGVFRSLLDDPRFVAVGADLDDLFCDGCQDAFPDFPDDVSVPLPPQEAGCGGNDGIQRRLETDPPVIRPTPVARFLAGGLD